MNISELAEKCLNGNMNINISNNIDNENDNYIIYDIDIEDKNILIQLSFEIEKSSYNNDSDIVGPDYNIYYKNDILLIMADNKYLDLIQYINFSYSLNSISRYDKK